METVHLLVDVARVGIVEFEYGVVRFLYAVRKFRCPAGIGECNGVLLLEYLLEVGVDEHIRHIGWGVFGSRSHVDAFVHHLIVCLVHLDDVLFGLWDVFELSVLGEDIQDFINHVGQYALVVIGKSSAVDLFVIHKGRLVQRLYLFHRIPVQNDGLVQSLNLCGIDFLGQFAFQAFLGILNGLAQCVVRLFRRNGFVCQCGVGFCYFGIECTHGTRHVGRTEVLDVEIVEQRPVVGVRAGGHGDTETEFTVLAHIACNSGRIVGTVVESKGGLSSGYAVWNPLSVDGCSRSGNL